MASIQLSVLIVNYKSEEFIFECLASLKRNLQAISYEVIVIDNSSSGSLASKAQEVLPDAKMLNSMTNRGFSQAVNHGLREAKGEFLLWLNPDSEILNHGLSDMVGYLKDHPKVGILGPKIQNPDGTIQYSCRAFPNHVTALFNRYSVLTKLFPNNYFTRGYLHTDWDRAAIHQVDWVSGACLLMRRELLQTVGYLDERFFMYCEDVDYCLRASQQGWGVYYHPALSVLHHIGGSSKKLRTRMIIERHKSMWRYYLKHYPRNLFLDALTGLGILLRGSFVFLSDLMRMVWGKG